MPDRRRTRRATATNATCNKGRVIDLSTKGMRLAVRRPWPEGQQRRVILRHAGQCITLWAECVWRRKDAPLKHTIGLAFVNPDEDHNAFLARAAANPATELPMLIPLGPVSP